MPILTALAASLCFLQSPVKPSDLYTQSLTRPDGTIEMRTRARRFSAAGKPDVWLVGAVHVGSRAYYSEVQDLLNRQDTVLYEGVRQNRTAPMVMKPSAKAPRSVYRVLSDAIGLDFQLEDIDYSRHGWENADLTWPEIQKLSKAAGKGKPTGVDTISQVLNPQSPMAKMFTTMITSATPGTREAFKIIMVKSVAEGKGPSLDAVTSDIVVKARNKAVEKRLAEVVADKSHPKSVGIFYGALHLPGVEQDIEKKYGYKPVEDHWYTSATADPKKLDATGKAILDGFQKAIKSKAPAFAGLS